MKQPRDCELARTSGSHFFTLWQGNLECAECGEPAPEYCFPAGPVFTALDFGRTAPRQPGEPGYWRVHGARAYDIRVGDLVLTGWDDDDGIRRHGDYEVAAFAPRGDDLHDQIRPRFLATNGEWFSVGALQPIGLLRAGTHGTLADSVR
jgi:hypothetical protein